MDNKFKVGDYVICRESHSEESLWAEAMKATVGKKLVILELSRFGNWWCRCEETRDCFWYEPQWLEPYPKKRRKPKVLKVGDLVICRKKGKVTNAVDWHLLMDRTIGKPMVVVGMSTQGYPRCRVDGEENTWTYLPEWLEYYTEKGNEEVKKDGNNLSPIVVDENVYYGIKEIISNPAKRATTVIFNDGKKVCVKAGVDVERPDIYSAVTAAIGIHFAGSNNALKTIIKKKTTELKPKRKGTRKEFTIEAGDLVKLTRRAKKDAAFPADAHDGENHPHLKVRINEEDADREMLVTKVEDGIVYANVPERVKDYDYKIPVKFLRITRKGE